MKKIKMQKIRGKMFFLSSKDHAKLLKGKKPSLFGRFKIWNGSRRYGVDSFFDQNKFT